MTVRGAVMAMTVLAWATTLQAQVDETRPAIDRPEIIEVGDPILITRKMLGAEMGRNSDLREWVRLYGAPDYAEVQEIQIDPPWAPYEVRLYYVRRNGYLAFGRVYVAPTVSDYGVRKFFGPINAAVLDRLLTAKPVELQAKAEPAPAAVQPVGVLVETDAVEGVPIAN